MPSNATKAEAKDELTVSFKFEDATYTIGTAQEWDLDAVEGLEDGLVVQFIRSVLGPEQWKTYKAKPRKVRDAEALFEAIQTAVGIQGN